MVPLGAMLVVALTGRTSGMQHAVETAVAGMVTLVPEGLVLLVSLTFAAAAVRLTRLGALVQQLNAIESIASVDTLCIDKTGTLTDASIRVVEVEPAEGVEQAELERRARAASSPRARRDEHDRWTLSPRRFPRCGGAARDRTVLLAAALERRPVSTTSTLVLGAPELFALGAARRAGARRAGAGRRVVAIGSASAGFPADLDDGPPPLPSSSVSPILAETLRADAPETIAFLATEGVDVKVLSGDDPATVLSIARDVGVTNGRWCRRRPGATRGRRGARPGRLGRDASSGGSRPRESGASSRR